MTSVRRRILLGAILWTIGLLSTWSVVLTYNHPAFEALRVVHTHAALMIVLAALCMAAGLAVVTAALAPLKELRRRLAAVRDGSEHQLRGQYPAEVQPLVDDLNALLAHLDEVVVRAGAKAGDLAHGLKTPLAILSNEADRLATRGETDLAAIVGEQVARMRRHVDYHLAHARAAASGTALHVQTRLGDSIDGLVRTMRQLYIARGLAIASSVHPEHVFNGRREDLDEMAGNLLDNACKWARARVTIASSVRGERLVVTIDDDGPGLDPEARVLVLRRGVRADEAVPGFGLGLAIVRDLAELYGGTLELDESALGGLAARLELPGSQSESAGQTSRPGV